uniref:Uncharacterized protein n=1 Tax=Rangifer tarandus platyrhynchus TaxID=3082113 RepID=A0ACB0DRE5_RANTA|nr:unnamed protein product [Rangifer tarandus platyrhynchus]
METRARRPAGRAGEADPTERGPGPVGSAWPPRPRQSFQAALSPPSTARDPPPSRPRQHLPAPTRQSPPRPLLQVPVGEAPSAAETLRTRPSRENQSYRSRGPQLHTKPPTAPRRLSASLLRFREPRERRSTLPRPLPRGTPPTGSLQREVRCRSREHPGPSARRTLSLQMNGRYRLREEGSAWGILTLGLARPRRVGTSPGKTRGLTPGCREPAGSFRAAASEGRPLPSGRGPAAAACAPPSAPPIAPSPPRPAGPAQRALRPLPVLLPASHPATPFLGRFPPLLSARREQSAL